MMDIIQTYGLPTLIAAVIAYLLGSISFAIPVTKLFIGKDIRTMGSGNAGFTNVLRCVGKPAAVITFIGDFAKGIGAIFLGEMIFHLMCPGVANIDETAKVGAAVAGLFAVLGHLFPLYFGFRGGKGVLISAGIICALDWRTFLVLAAVFLVVLLITKTVSKGSLTVAALYPIVTCLLNTVIAPSDAWLALTLISVCFAALVIYMHRSNIRRILDGTEPKTIAKKNS
ncbi:MAG: glycerol-3-phosphate 1-O-acyltransferase PlsY [Clostridia bacterium]|nr:glycerol-3-phosphate 1-O-acyltransferase PlsY [Clostridia bacterium]